MDPKGHTRLFLFPVCGSVLAFLGMQLLTREVVAAPQHLPSLADYSVWQWKTEHGLPHNRIRCLLQTSDGYIWIGTAAGLVRFDGVRFTTFDRVNVPEMRSDNCVALAEDAQHALWIGTEEGGLLRWRNHRFDTFTAASSGLSNDQIRYLHANASGGLWIGTGNGLNLWADDHFTPFSTDDGLLDNNIRAVFEDSSGTVWAGAEVNHYEGSLQRLDPRTGRFVSVTDKPAHVSYAVHRFVELPDGRVWWGDNRGLHEMAGGQTRDSCVEDGLSGEVVRFLSLARDRGLWVLTGHRGETPGRPGLHHFAGGKAVRIDLAPAGVGEEPTCCLEDREGSLWLGTPTDGLLCLQPRRVRMIDPAGSVNPAVQSVSAGSDGSVWIAADWLLRWNQGRLVAYADPSLPNLCCPVTAVLATQGGEVLIGAFSNGIKEVEEGQFNGPVGSTPYVLYEDSAGVTWAGCNDRLYRRPPRMSNRMSSFENESYFDRQTCHAIAQDQEGAFWFGTAAGAWRYAASIKPGGEVRLLPFSRQEREPRVHWSRTNGLSSDKVLSLFQDSEHKLWIGTDNGLDRWHKGQMRHVSTRQGLADNSVNSMVEDDSGCFWIGSNHGVFRVARQELNAVAEGQSGRVRCFLLGEADGMATVQVTSEHQPAACKSPDGRLWFATSRGVAVIDPKQVRVNDAPPLVQIEQVRVDDRVYGDPELPASQSKAAGPEVSPGALEDVIRLPPGHGRFVEFRYAANSFIAPSRVRLEYRLDGYDEGWRLDLGDRVARYGNLRPGSYRFRVKAANSDGVESKEPVECCFVLRPHVYETWPFYPACGVVLIGAALGVQGYRLRVQRRLLSLQNQHSLDMERARIAADIHDDLGSRFSQLAVLQELADRNLPDAAEARPHLRKLRIAIGDAFQALDEIVWAANPKQDSLEGLVFYLREYIPEFLGPAGLRCHLEFPTPVPKRELSAQVRHHLFLTVKEALQNVVKHARATNVRLKLTIEETLLLLILQDDGCGFPAPNGQGNLSWGSAATPAALGNGLTNMRDRMHQLGGELQIHTTPGQGTEVVLRLPL